MSLFLYCFINPNSIFIVSQFISLRLDLEPACNEGNETKFCFEC